MLQSPFIRNCAPKIYHIALLILITIMYIAVCAEADIYVPAFPQMISYFGVEENQIQLILSLNFLGLCLAGLIAGPLSDSYGRRSILLGGLFLFVVSSLGCVCSTNFLPLLFWRLVQGVGASVPMVIGMVIIVDKYSQEKSGQLISVLNSVIAAAMAGAPIAGAWLSQQFGWKINFVVILLLALISFLGSLSFIEESLPVTNRKKFNLKNSVKEYGQILKSIRFISYTLIACLPFTAIVVYIANLSIVFINYGGLSAEELGYYQATTMATFIVFSLIAAKSIPKMGVDFTKNIGGFLTIVGSFSFFYVSSTDPYNINLICISVAFSAAGGAMMAGTFGMKALSTFPNMAGSAMAMMTAIRQLLAAGLVVVSEILFDGTLKPVATIIGIYTIVAIIAYIINYFFDAKEPRLKSQPESL